VGNCHKWLCAPKGAGFLYARPERQALLDPLIISWGWQAERPGPSPFVDHFGSSGTADPSAYLAVPAAIQFQREHNWPSVRAACRLLVRDARERVASLTGLPQVTPDSDAFWRQLAIIPVPVTPAAGARHAAELKERLYDEYGVEIFCPVFQGQSYVRISIQAYNTRTDVDRLVDALTEILA
jgi:isopenicillin-N epimerase